MKKIISLILVLALALCLVPVLAEEEALKLLLQCWLKKKPPMRKRLSWN